ncbi:MAG: hypothetical protein OER43_10220 [Gammaproteobacteria bacterium]|nr:hypothetical protein [Gammaproteobacteria bacterium]
MILKHLARFLPKLVVGAFVACALPSSATDSEPVFVDIAAGWAHACALERESRVWCWGNAVLNGHEADSEELVPVRGLDDIKAIFAGPLGTCAVNSIGRAVCWGADFQQTEERGELVDSAQPFEVEGLPPVTQIAIGYVHVCGLSIVGDVYCWGQNPRGELGNGTDRGSAVPLKVQGIKKAVVIGAGVNNTCAVEAGGAVSCWGTDNQGIGSGAGFVINSKVPQFVPNIRDIRAVANGRNYVCGLNRGGGVQCWGSTLAMPTQDSPQIRLPIVQMDVGAFKGCVVYQGGTLQCWNYDDRTPRVDARLKKVRKVSVGGDVNACVLLASGSVHCLEKDGDYKKIVLPPG